MSNDEAHRAVWWALEVSLFHGPGGVAVVASDKLPAKSGYRHIDSAEWSDNEEGCGRAIREFITDRGLQRSDVFYTSKLKSNSGKFSAARAIDRSLEECGLGYIDLYLVHSPLGGPQMRRESWETIVEAQKEGKLRSVGISNFGVQHMEELLDKGLPDPVVNQYCTRRGILLEAWAPLVEAMRFDHPAVTRLAKKYDKEPAQILLRYSLQKGFIPLPKSSHKKRITSNTQIHDFELAKEEVEHLDSLDKALVTNWDPTYCP